MSASGPRASSKQRMNEEHGWIQCPSLSRLEDSAPAGTMRGDALTGFPLAVLRGSLLPLLCPTRSSGVLSFRCPRPTRSSGGLSFLCPHPTRSSGGSLLPLPASHTPHRVTQSLPSVSKESTCNAGDPGLIPGSGRSAGKGNGYILQYSRASLWLS